MLTSYLCSLLLSQSLLLVFYSSYLLISLFGEQPKKKGTTRKILIVLIIIVIITCTSIWVKKLGAITLTGLASCGIISSIIHFQFGFGFHLFFFCGPTLKTMLFPTQHSQWVAKIFSYPISEYSNILQSKIIALLVNFIKY